MKNTFFIVIGLLNLILFSSCSEQKNVQLTSPNDAYTFNLDLDNSQAKPMYTVVYKGKEIIKKSALGLTFQSDVSVTEGLKIDSVIFNNVKTEWEPVYGEKNLYKDIYKEALVYFNPGDNKTPVFNLRIRAYDEGVAFRYEFLEDENFVIEDEKTEFALGAGTQVWVSDKAQSHIKKTNIEKLKETYARPLMAQNKDSVFVCIGEADLIDFARFQFALSDAENGILKTTLTTQWHVNNYDSGIQKVVLNSGETKMPWRYIMAGKKAGDILENNYLVLNLSEPCKLEDTSWIIPGKVLREVTLTTQGGFACVDFAKKHNIKYVLFDAGWYGDERDDASDATTVTLDPNRSKGPLNLKKVIEYGKKNDILVMLYVNRRSLEKQLDDVLPFFKSWGIKAMKFGFVNVGTQHWTTWLHESVIEAAHHNIMVNVHDEYRPTGYSRTYPNLMTQEGIRGEEESPSNEHTLKTIFTRCIAGASDNTNCYFDPRVDEECSHTTQLAKTVCIYSPWQYLYWYDRPVGSPAKVGGAGGTENFIYEVPELKWFDEVPTVWDDTKVLMSDIGKLACIARKKGNDWYLGLINGTTQRDVSIPLDFLDEDKQYEATIYYDDESVKTVTKVGIDKIDVKRKDFVRRTILKNNGLAIKFSPK